MKSRILFIVILILSISSFAFSSSVDPTNPVSGKIRGIVKDEKALEAIEYANVALYAKEDSTLISGTITNKKGHFELEGIVEGEYYLTVDFIGFKKKLIENLSIARKKRVVDLGELLLQQASYKLDEVVVSGERNFVDFKIDKKVVNVAKHANAAGGTVSDVLENVPSVNVDIEGNTSLRGSSSFTVLIDGKPSPVAGSEILKQIPASTVESIEIITNPSAKYDPEGTTGIINIIMKKGYSEGLNGMISANYATWDKVGADLNLNYRKEKMNFFLIGNYMNRPNNAVSENNRQVFLEDEVFHVDENTDRRRVMKPYKINPGIDFYINNNNTLSLSATIGGWGMDRLFDSRYSTYTGENENATYSTSENDFSIDGKYYVANANFQHLFAKKGHKIDLNIAAWRWNNLQTERSYELESDASFNPVQSLAHARSNLDEQRNNLHFKADYIFPLDKGKIELGLDSRINLQSGDLTYENQDILTKDWIINPDFTYQSEFYRNLYAAYATYSGELIGFEYQLGLRSEITERNVIQLDSEIEYPLDLFKLYPSFHVSKNINDKQQLQFSYSRRINRPQPWQLNPYPGYSDSYNYFQGNPLLEPEDTDALELNYINRFEKLTLSTGLYFRQSFNSQEMVQEINAEDPNIVYLSIGNIDRTASMGMEYMLNYLPMNGLNINLSGNVYHFNVESSFLGEEVEKSSINWDARLNTTYTLGKTARLQFSGIYNSPSVRGQGTSKAFYYFDLGLRKSFLERKLNVALLVHNIFSTGSFETMVETPDFSSSFYYKGQSPVVRLSVSYIINNFQRKQRSQIDLGAGAN